MPSDTEILSAYLPATLLRGVIADPDRFGSPWSEVEPGVLLFADIVGFTTLTEEFATRGQEGIEELTALLDACFGRLVGTVRANGGDVLRFPGDAALAYWPDKGDQVLLACKCALELQARFGQGARETANLGLRIAIAAGPVTCAYVGGADGRWEFVVLGGAFTDLGTAARLAEPGQTVMSAEAWRRAGDHVRGEECEGSLRLAELVGEAVAPESKVAIAGELAPVLRAFVPPPILVRLDAGQLEWLAEFRTVSVLFLELAGIDSSSGRLLATLQDAILATQTVLAQFGGGINQIVVDDKGLIVLAVWGSGLHTHEDDAARAVRAAMALSQSLRPKLPEVRIGIASGRAYCGRRGTLERCEYAVIGKTVNLAARLMGAAASEILCDSVTFEAARSRVEFEPLDAISVKGSKEPVPVYRPIKVRRVEAMDRGALVGRDAERQRLHECVDALIDGKPGVVVIEGEAGIGKSRLVADLLDYARGEQAVD